jgi:hypothetical protein
LSAVKALFEQLGILELHDRPLEELTEAFWFREWENQPDPGKLRSNFEPTTWPPTDLKDKIILFIERGRRIYLHPGSGEPILLGELSDGKDEIIRRLQNIPVPPFRDILPANTTLREEDSDLLHPELNSVRFKAISTAIYGA